MPIFLRTRRDDELVVYSEEEKQRCYRENWQYPFGLRHNCKISSLLLLEIPLVSLVGKPRAIGVMPATRLRIIMERGSHYTAIGRDGQKKKLMSRISFHCFTKKSYALQLHYSLLWFLHLILLLVILKELFFRLQYNTPSD